ncbi:MAG: CARDB domain-containing protein, partial [Anaerolineae bacterium]
GLDPTALIANGGIVQPTPCRMMYLDIVWDTYQQSYSETMPVDVWNIHTFILREVYGSWGASTPPGVPTSCGIDYKIRDGDDIDIFRNNLIAFRQWMKDKGEQNKPLIISEYGILWPNWLKDEDGVGWSPARVSYFMTQTFDLFLNETYPDVGYPEDDYRLVQTWAWYSISDTYYNGKLFEPSTRQLSPMGHTYADYTAALTDTPYADLTVQLWLDLEALDHISPAASYDVLTVTLPATGAVANLGKLPVNILVSAPLLDYQSTLSVPARYEQNVGTLALPSLVLTRSGLYDLSFVADPAQVIADPRRWNNAVTITVEARPDLVTTGTTWSVQSSGTLSNVLHITLTVANEGVWPTPPVSGTLYLSSVLESLLLVSAQNPYGVLHFMRNSKDGVLGFSKKLFLSSQPFPIPAIGSGVQVTITEKVPLPSLISGPYRITIEADSDDAVNEQDENNNRVEFEADLRPDLVISTTTWSMQPWGTLSGMLSVTLMVANEGTVSTPSVSGTLYLSNTSGSLLLPAHRFLIPAIAAGDQVTITQEIVLPVSDEDFYRLALEVDSDGILNEPNENNNRVEMLIPIVVTTTLEPGAASVLTSASGHITFQFLTGTVATSTELCFVPLWPPELPSGPLLAIEAFRLTTCQGEPPVSPTLLLPVTVTWQYTDMDVVGLDEDKLGLYHGRESNRWQRVSCPAEQHWPNENRLSTCIQQLGKYVFGYVYELFLPIVMSNSKGSGSRVYLEAQS